MQPTGIEKLDRKMRTWSLPMEKLMQFECEVILKSGTRPRRKVHKLTKDKEKLELVFKDGFFYCFSKQQTLVCINIYDDEGVFLSSTNDTVVFGLEDT